MAKFSSRNRVLRSRPAPAKGKWTGKRFLRRRAKPYKGSVISSGGFPFPPKLMTKMTYADTYPLTIDSAAGTMTTQTFRLNSVYDVDYTGAGHQPKYLDTLLGADGGNAPYRRCVVMGCKVKMSFINGNSSGGTIGYVGFRIRRSDVAACTDADVAKETPNTKVMFIGPNGNSRSVRNISMYSKSKTYLQCKDVLDCEEAYILYNTNPTQEIYGDCFYQPVTTGTSGTLYVQVKLTYYVQFLDRNTVTTS